MKIGITGTRNGMNLNQQRWLISALVINKAKIKEVHHGDCQGVDYECATLAAECKFKTVSHPPKYEKWRAFHQSDEIREPKDYRDRNEDIVNECDLLIAIPRENEEQWKGGTWQTFRYALCLKKGLYWFCQTV